MIAVVIGGSGFLGRRLVHRLRTEGATVRVAVRDAERAKAAFSKEGLGAVEVVRADVREPSSLEAALDGADAAINAVSGYVERRGASFADIHERGAENAARAASAKRVRRLVLVSGIGADAASPSPYIRARGHGEELTRAAFPAATIVRPSAMFGKGDALFEGLAGMARLLPALPLVGGGGTRLQPVHVEDVAAAIARILADPATVGRTFELAGPKVYTLHELVALALRLSGRRRLLLPLPLGLAHLQARLLELLPSPPLTTAQVDLLRMDNLASGKLPGFDDLGITPRAAEDVVPTYLGEPGRAS